MTGERQLIKKIKEWTGAEKIGDDCAVLAGQGLVSSDMLVEGRHFELNGADDFNALGWKSCAVNLSDIAAMGGRPRYLTVALSLPTYVSERDLQSFYQGFNQCARQYRAEVVGGDLTAGDRLVIAVTVIGESHEKGLLRRSGARPGDQIIVSGDFGASALGLRVLQASGTGKNLSGALFEHAVEAHRRPQPRFSAAHALVERVGSRGALMDASDGLADALYQICEASGVSAQVNLDLIPIDQSVRQGCLALGLDLLPLALYGGEDYELVACADLQGANNPASMDFLEGALPFVSIGHVLAQEEPGVPVVALSQKIDGKQKIVSFVDLNNCYQHFC